MDILSNLAPAIITVFMTIVNIITIVKKVPNGERIARLECEVRVLRRMLRDNNDNTREIKNICVNIARHQKGIKQDVK